MKSGGRSKQRSVGGETHKARALARTDDRRADARIVAGRGYACTDGRMRLPAEQRARSWCGRLRLQHSMRSGMLGSRHGNVLAQHARRYAWHFAQQYAGISILLQRSQCHALSSIKHENYTYLAQMHKEKACKPYFGLEKKMRMTADRIITELQSGGN